MCPILGGLIGLQFVGYIGNTAADQILIHTINNALLADDNPLNVLLGPIGKTVNEVLAEGNMAISDSLYAPGAAFIALGALIQE